jgi:vacuolar-type H+-ATPase catalytic subunit A/Vma1
VLRTGKPLSVELGPGEFGPVSVFDGAHVQVLWETSTSAHIFVGGIIQHY